MSPKPTVVVTGLGVVSSVGLGWKPFWRSLLEGHNAVGPITHFDATGYSTRFAAEIRDFDPSVYVGRKEARRMDRCIQFGVAAASMALEDSGLEVTPANA